MYEWRRMSPKEQADTLAARRLLSQPWHSPPHWHDDIDSATGSRQYLISAACFSHTHIIGTTNQRMDAFAAELLNTVRDSSLDVYAWAVLTNHYHVLLRTDRIRHLIAALGRLHGRTSRFWNLEDAVVGRQVWHRCAERRMKSERHFWTTLNYVHHQAVRHGYVMKWTDWPWSSAVAFLENMGRDEAMRIWREYPLRNYGDKWDL